MVVGKVVIFFGVFLDLVKLTVCQKMNKQPATPLLMPSTRFADVCDSSTLLARPIAKTPRRRSRRPDWLPREYKIDRKGSIIIPPQNIQDVTPVE